MLTAMLIAFFVLLLTGVPLVFVMGLTGMLGVLMDSTLPNMLFAQRIFNTFDNFALLAIPLFMLAGSLMNHTGITVKILNFANALVGHLPGGLGHATTITGVVMAGISGSANADAAAIGAVMVPALKMAGYGEAFSVSLVAAAGVLGPIIPPSIIMIIYASATGLSIASLFAAGIVPGLVIALGYMVYTTIYALKTHIKRLPRAGLRKLLISFKESVWALIMPFIIIGGILGGVFTATEAGAIAVLYGVIYGVATKTLNKKVFMTCLAGGVISAAGPSLIMATSNVMTLIMTRENLSAILVAYMTSLTTNYYLMLVLVIIIITILGMFIEVTSAMLMSIPILAPLVVTMGYDPLYFASIVVITFVVGGISPPVGIVLYIVAGIENTPLSGPVKHIWPFVGIITLVVIAIMFFPGIVLFLPRILGLA
jgi:C4-dicarboxylate transporter DctM subunit